MLRSSKAVHENPPAVAWGQRWAAPDPRAGAGIQLAGRDLGGQGDLLWGSKRLPGQGLATKQPPPALLQVQRAGPLGNEGVLDAGWSASQVRVLALVWLDRLSVITMMVPAGLAASTAASRCW